MNIEIIIVSVVVAVAFLALAIGYYLREVRAERRRWATYADYRGGEPKSAVCPNCHKRIYSLRAIRDRICIHCNTNY